MMVNALAPARLCHHYLTGMIRKGYGHILNVSSTAGESFAPYYATYVGAKAFVFQFTRSLSLEMPEGVSVSCLIPGPTATVAEQLLRAHPQLPFRVDVSLDGMRDTHDTIRNMPGSFERARRSVSSISCKNAILGSMWA